MRYFANIDYVGTGFSGWQKQPNAPSIQQELETWISTIKQKKVSLIGCGRTDAGVHARNYVAHFDFDDWDSNDTHKLNRAIDPRIAIKNIYPVSEEMHARFSAKSRSYNYYIHWKKDPFLEGLSYFVPNFYREKVLEMQGVTDLLMNYQEFKPFCKSNHDSPHYLCDLMYADWKNITEHRACLQIKSNRFLRGMVRLIVGSCLLVAFEKITLSDVRKSMEEQSPLPKSLSAEAQGLFFDGVEY